MDGFEGTPATGAPDTGGAASQAVHNHSSAAESYFEQPQGATEPSEAATGSDTPGQEPEPAMVPSHVLRERTERHRTEMEQLRQQFEPLTPYQEVVQTLADAGVTPDVLLQRLLGPEQATPEAPAATDPETAFQSWAQEQGYDLAYASEAEVRAAQREFRAEQTLARLEQAEQRAQLAEAQAEVSREIAAAVQRFPVLQNPKLNEAFMAQAMMTLEAGGTIAQAAERFNTTLDEMKRSWLSEYSAGKQADAQAPVTAGGSAPAPVARADFHNLSPSKRTEFFEDYMATSQTPA